MRKIIIDDRIRGFSTSYATKVQEQCPNVIQDLETLRDNVISYNVWRDSNVIKDYLNQIIADYPGLLTLEPKDWNLGKYSKILRKEPALLSMKVNYEVNERYADGSPKTYHEGKFYERIMFCLRYQKARIILGAIHQDMGLKACVYCNTQSTRSANNEVFYEMDHLKAQSQYPFLGTCFYNLQPSDSDCNKRKSTKPCGFQLYVNNAKEELSPFKFLPHITSIPVKQTFDCVSIDFVSKNGIKTKESIHYESTFHLKNLYAAYTDVVSKLYDKNNKMCAGMVSAYKASLNYTPSESEQTEFLLDCPYDESRIHEDVLRKLKVDTMKQLDDAGLLIK